MATWQCAGCGKVWRAEEPPAECACGCRIVREAVVTPVEAKPPAAPEPAPSCVSSALTVSGRRPPWAAVFAGAAAVLLVAGVAFWLGRAGRPAAVPSAGGAALEPSVLKAGPAKSAASLKAGDAQTVELGGGVKLELVWCPPGTFWMGSEEGEADRSKGESRHRVTLTKGFWIGKTEVTQAQWEEVVGGGNRSDFKGADLPVENVSWEECQEFCRRLNERASGGGFRLPTEAEWEYACRAGTTGPFNVDGADLGDLGWYDKNSGNKTHPVVQKRPNAWGIHDMHGNVWEWCADWYGEYPEHGVSDPVGAASGSNRVRRGGSWSFNAWYCRSAYRSNIVPSHRNDVLGFRLARTLP